jgi:hypothetical protein
MYSLIIAVRNGIEVVPFVIDINEEEYRTLGFIDGSSSEEATDYDSELSDLENEVKNEIGGCDVSDDATQYDQAYEIMRNEEWRDEYEKKEIRKRQNNEERFEKNEVFYEIDFKIRSELSEWTRKHLFRSG